MCMFCTSLLFADPLGDSVATQKPAITTQYELQDNWIVKIQKTDYSFVSGTTDSASVRKYSGDIQILKLVYVPDSLSASFAGISSDSLKSFIISEQKKILIRRNLVLTNPWIAHFSLTKSEQWVVYENNKITVTETKETDVAVYIVIFLYTLLLVLPFLTCYLFAESGRWLSTLLLNFSMIVGYYFTFLAADIPKEQWLKTLPVVLGCHITAWIWSIRKRRKEKLERNSLKLR